MNILITGGCGFIGSNLVEYNLNRGHSVFIVDDLSSGTMENIAEFIKNPNLKVAIADINSWDGLTEAVQWADCIYHMAAVVGVFRVLSKPVDVINTNVSGTARLFKLIQESKSRPRVIVASSSMVYGNTNNKELAENNELHFQTTTQGHWLYAISKLVDESIASSYYQECNIPATIVRIFNTIGPRQSGRYGMVVPRFIQQAIYNEPITVYGDGKQTRSFCDIRDQVYLMNELINNKETIGQIVNLGHDQEIDINDLARMIRQRANSYSKITHISYHEAYGTDFTDIMSRKPDLTKLKSLINYRIDWSLEQTIDDLILRAKNKHK